MIKQFNARKLNSTAYVHLFQSTFRYSAYLKQQIKHSSVAN